jgi:hypothetical protein
MTSCLTLLVRTRLVYNGGTIVLACRTQLKGTVRLLRVVPLPAGPVALPFGRIEASIRTGLAFVLPGAPIGG